MTDHLFDYYAFLSFPLLVCALMFPVNVQGATLKPETIAAWGDYVQAANAAHQNRILPGGSFLWTLDDADRAAKVRAGEIVVAPASDKIPRKVSGGLIHHWIGAMFVPHVTLDQILAVARDYDRYKDFYRPSVVESKAVAIDGSNDRFSMALMNKAFFLKTALDADYQAENVRFDDRRLYIVSRTTRVQEVEEYGRTGEHRIPEGHGGGYIWKLHSISRLEERDGGVYVELEAIALSRDIPAMMHFIVDPIVRRVSRNSLLVSLQQTQDAVRSATVAKAAKITASSESPRPKQGSLRLSVLHLLHSSDSSDSNALAFGEESNQ